MASFGYWTSVSGPDDLSHYIATRIVARCTQPGKGERQGKSAALLISVEESAAVPTLYYLHHVVVCIGPEVQQSCRFGP